MRARVDDKIALAWAFTTVLFSASILAYLDTLDLSHKAEGGCLLGIAFVNLVVHWLSQKVLKQRIAAGVSLTIAAIILPIAFFDLFHANSVPNPLGFFITDDISSELPRAAIWQALAAAGAVCLAMIRLTDNERWALPGFLYFGLAAPVLFSDFFTETQTAAHAGAAAAVAVIAVIVGWILNTKFYFYRGQRSATAAATLLFIYAYALLQTPTSLTMEVIFAGLLLLFISGLAYYAPSVGAVISVLIALAIFSDVLTEHNLQTLAFVLVVVSIAAAIGFGLIVFKSIRKPPELLPEPEAP